MSFDFTVVNTEGATFTPWTDGYAVGFKVTAESKPTRYVYLNPSSETDTEDINDSDVFTYFGEHGHPGEDAALNHINIWSAEEVRE